MTTSISRGRFRVWLTKNLDEPMSRGGIGSCPLACWLTSTNKISAVVTLSRVFTGSSPSRLLNEWELEFRSNHDLWAPASNGRGALWVLDTLCVGGINRSRRSAFHEGYGEGNG